MQKGTSPKIEHQDGFNYRYDGSWVVDWEEMINEQFTPNTYIYVYIHAVCTFPKWITRYFHQIKIEWENIMENGSGK